MTTFSDYFRIWRRRGVIRLLDEIRENLWFDLRFGIDTQTIFSSDMTQIGDENAEQIIPYAPSYAAPVRKFLDRLAIYITGHDFSFFDIGCGKGKVLILAAQSGLFKKIYGIEIVPGVAQIADQNIRKMGFSDQIDVLLTNAITFESYSKRSVLFLYNPLNENMFLELLRILERTSLQEAYLVYSDPRFGRLLNLWREVYTSGWRDDQGRTLKIFYRNFDDTTSS